MISSNFPKQMKNQQYSVADSYMLTLIVSVFYSQYNYLFIIFGY